MRPTDEELLVIAADHRIICLAGIGEGPFDSLLAMLRTLYRMGQEDMRERAAVLVETGGQMGAADSYEDFVIAIRALEVEPL